MKQCLFLVVVLIAGISTSCDDIFLKDISNDEVAIICPADGYTTTSSENILFWWDGMDGASEYELQIASPDFQNITQLKVEAILDTIRHSVALPAGDYQWRIRGLNNGYASQFVTRNLHLSNTK